MKYRIIVRPEAEGDLSEAFLWYEDKRKGLGHDFLLHIDAGIRFIARNPNIYKSEYRDTRKHLVKRFPYKIIYLIHNESLIILAVLHMRRNPALLKKRLRKL
ncbi:MAG: type II toxin-antitoxin system RelE/ParE family toxin [Ignavibacteriaceae bacterium]|nr:type II toxin-antitoxin system RelE/ParE family toxin [Ignavibacteriaceae bacterium]